MMGTEKIDRRSVCTVALSVLLSLLLALTPVLAVAEPANGGSASADAAEATPGDSESSETSGDASVDATKTTPPQSDSSASADTAIAPAESDPSASADAATIAPASTSLVTVPATQTSTSTTSLRATVSYDSNFVKGSTTRLTFNVSGNTKPLKYRLYSFEMNTGEYSNSWSSIIDISKSSASSFSERNYFEIPLYLAGTYRIVFNAQENDGGNHTRFAMTFTVPESADFKSMETIINEVIAQCDNECTKQGDTSDYAKALWLNDWVVDNTQYDNTYTYISAEGVFGRGLGDCEAYHDAYVRLLNRVDIETRRVDSYGDAHVWTGVKLDEKWYNVDTTWNDPGYTMPNIDLKRLYFALPSGIMGLVHQRWDGNYLVGYPDRASFDASSYEDNYFIRSGEISNYTAPYLEASGTYSVQTHLDARESSFTIPVVNNGWPAGYKNVIYNLVAYQLGQESWRDGVGVVVAYADDNLSFRVTYDGSDLPISITSALISNIGDVDYSGKEQTPTPTVTVNGTELVKDRDYTISYGNNVNAGSNASITIEGIGDYFASATRYFTINRLYIHNASIASIANQQYTGSALEPKLQVSYGGRQLVENVDYTVRYSNNVEVGTATATITGKGNYSSTKSTTFTIEKKPDGSSGNTGSGGSTEQTKTSIGNATVSGIATQTYTGKALTPKPTVKVGATKLQEGTDYTLSYANNTNAGTATVTVTGKGNYTGTVTKTFAIAKRSISGATVSVATQTYTGKALTPKPTVKVGTITLKEGTDYNLSYANNTNVGKATVTITGKGNYTGERKAIFVIEAKPNTPAGGNGSGSSSSGGSTSGGSGSSGSGSPTTQPAAQVPAVTGSWVNSGRWWFSYDAKTRAAQRKAYPVNEWVKVGNRRYHFDGAGWMHSGWLSLSGRWYWLGADGAMRTGWQLVGGAWYYMGPDGAMLTGRQKVGDATYYLASSGAMRTGWSLEDNTWYFYDGSGAMAHGWRSVGGTWYFLDRSSGAMRQYWLDEGSQRYFLLSSGAMVTGWARVDGTWYYFGPSGAMQKNRWVGNYYVGSDGRMATSTWVGRYHVNASGLWDATR